MNLCLFGATGDQTKGSSNDKCLIFGQSCMILRAHPFLVFTTPAPAKLSVHQMSTVKMSVHHEMRSLNLQMPPKKIDYCYPICEDSRDLYLLVFKIDKQMASPDFILQNVLFVQNNTHLIPTCKNKGKQEYLLFVIVYLSHKAVEVE